MAEAQVDEVAKLIARRFIERRDTKAVQLKDGAYVPDRERLSGDRGAPTGAGKPFRMSDMRAHLLGEATYGHYLVSPEGKCRLFAFDIDLSKKGLWRPDPNTDEYVEIDPRSVWLSTDEAHQETQRDLRVQLRCMGEALAVRANKLTELPTAVAYSGSKGVHVYCFTGSIDAAEAREAAQMVLDSFTCFEPFRGNNFYRHTIGYKCIDIEVFPKQDEVREGDGLGNLMRLPLGVNRKTGQNGYFLDLRSGLDEPWVPADPVEAMTNGTVVP